MCESGRGEGERRAVDGGEGERGWVSEMKCERMGVRESVREVERGWVREAERGRGREGACERVGERRREE